MQSSTKIMTGAALIMAVTIVIYFWALGRVRAADASSAAPRFEATERLITEKLDAAAELNTEQREKARTLIVAQLPALKKVSDRLAEGQAALREMMADLEVEEKTIRAETSKLADTLVEYAKQRARLVQQLKSLLTAEQLRREPERTSLHLARFVDEIVKALAKE